MEHLGEDEHLASLVGMDDDVQNTGSGLHISDVIDVIQMDTERAGIPTANTMADSGGGNRRHLSEKTPYVVIVEQPASKALRFRYECEGRSAGSIPGVNSTPEHKTYPAIKVVGYSGKAAVVVSCVTKDPPYRPHPHNLVGKDGCKEGVCSLHISSNDMVVTFSNLGIQCVKKKDIEGALKAREKMRVDPFKTGFSHRSHPTGIDLNAVRLCFQVFLEEPGSNTYTRPLTPVVSDPIYDKKAMSDLMICKLSDASASVAGGKEMILLCEKVAKEDIQIRFFEERDGLQKWEAYADFQPTNVHKQVAISFRTPRYERLEVDGPVSVLIQLKRPSDGATSEPLPFQLLPLDSDLKELKRKRQKYADDPSSTLLRHFQEPDKSRPNYTFTPSPDSNPLPSHSIKTEPSEAYFGGNLSPMYAAPGPSPPTHSPQLGRTPSPLDYHHQPQQQQFGMGYSYSQQGYGSAAAPTPSPGPPGPSATSMAIPMRSGLLAGGSCTAASGFSPVPTSPADLMRPGMQTPYQQAQAQAHALGLGPMPGLMAVGPGPVAGQVAGATGVPTQSLQPSASGMPSYESALPGPVPSLIELEGQYGELKQLNSGDLVQLVPWEGNLSEQMSCNLTLSESGPSSSSCKREVADADATWLQSQN